MNSLLLHNKLRISVQIFDYPSPYLLRGMFFSVQAHYLWKCTAVLIVNLVHKLFFVVLRIWCLWQLESKVQESEQHLFYTKTV